VAPSQQESGATTAKRCSIKGCGDPPILPEAPYCENHEERYGASWVICAREDCRASASAVFPFACSRHGGADYTPRTTADRPNPAPPEAKPCDDGKRKLTREQQAVADCLNCKGVGFLNLFTGEPVAFGEAMPEPDAQRCRACVSIEEELLLLGVAPLVPLTPEERAQDLVRWRRDIEEHNRGKETTP
jgi:hypothetical protein